MKSVSERKTIEITQETIDSLQYALSIIEEHKEVILKVLSYVQKVNEEAESIHSFSNEKRDFLYTAHDSAKAFSRNTNFSNLHEIYYEYDKLDEDKENPSF